MGKYFGTDGFRGEANVTLTVDHAFKVGRFIGWYFKKKKGCRVFKTWHDGFILLKKSSCWTFQFVQESQYLK